MKYYKKLIIPILTFLLWCSNILGVFAEGLWPVSPEIGSESGILMDATTGTVLYEKNPYETRFPASITKILTVLLALENGKMNDQITFSQDAVYKTEGTSIGIDIGETISVEDCIYGVMLGSANECAYALAEHIGGTYENFITMMNERVAEIGCVNTHFNNPHGLPDENHYTCAYDMALITKTAMENATFRNIFATKQHTIGPTNKTTESRPINNHHYMVLGKNSNYQYEGITGGKTGYTSKALNTLVTTASRDNLDLICVVMKTSTTHYGDTRSLLNYGFQNFSLVNISENEVDFNLETEEFLSIGKDVLGNSDYSLRLNKEDYLILPNGTDFSQATAEFAYKDLAEGTLARLTYTLDGHQIGQTDILLEENEPELIFAPTEEVMEKEDVVFTINLRLIFQWVAIVLGVLLVLVLLIRYRKFFGITWLLRKLKRRKIGKYPSKYKNLKF